MKRSLFLSMAILCTMMTFAQKFSVKPATGGVMEFKVLSKLTKEVALVSASNNNSVRLDIPEKVSYKKESYTVVSLAAASLKACDPALKELIIPNSVRDIESFLFVSVSQSSGSLIGAAFMMGLGGGKVKSKPSDMASAELTRLVISKNVKSIGHHAFSTTYSAAGETSKALNAHIDELPDFITASNAEQYGLGTGYVQEYWDLHGDNLSETGNSSNHLSASTMSDRKTKTLCSDVDMDIPSVSENNKTTFAVVFANENYQKESNVDFALNDGTMFKTYCNKVLGLPEKNIHFAEDATLNNMIFELDWLRKVCEAYGGQANVIVYYAGHGVPDEANGSSYLLPIDGTGQNLRTCYSLAEFYKTLGEMPTSQLTVFMDACFSGAKRSGEMLASARGVAIKSKSERPKGKMVVISAAQGDETAYAYQDNKHGLFTYFLLKKLKESKGGATLGDLGNYLTQQVSRYSIVENGKSQTPSVTASGMTDEQWKKLKLK